jgi:hypothetical protein
MEPAAEESAAAAPRDFRLDGAGPRNIDLQHFALRKRNGAFDQQTLFREVMNRDLGFPR